MKLPNGFGSVYKLSGKNRRNPWAARKTIGWTEPKGEKKPQPIYEFIGYYPTRAEALKALAEYNKSPYDISAASITFEEVYEKWSERKFSEVTKKNITDYNAAFSTCEKLHKMRFSDIKLEHMQRVIDESGKNQPTLKKVKSLLAQLFKYAVIHEIVPKDRNMTQYVDISRAGNPNSIKRERFKKKEIDALWKHAKGCDSPSIVLMLIYTGARISELLDLKREQVNIEEQWFDIIESKTDAGIRSVPIADKVLPFFRAWMNKANSPYLLSSQKGRHLQYQNYIETYWSPVMADIGAKHAPHDTRHTFVSLATAAGIDERLIRKIVGHKGEGITQQVYTHSEIEELLHAVNKI